MCQPRKLPLAVRPTRTWPWRALPRPCRAALSGGEGQQKGLVIDLTPDFGGPLPKSANRTVQRLQEPSSDCARRHSGPTDGMRMPCSCIKQGKKHGTPEVTEGQIYIMETTEDECKREIPQLNYGLLSLLAPSSITERH